MRRNLVVLGVLALVVGFASAADRQEVPTPAPVAAQTGSSFTPVAPVRVLDTRNGIGRPGNSPVGGGSSVGVNLTGIVPADAETVVLNVTGTNPTGATYVTVHPHGYERPNVSTLNLAPGETRANAAVVFIGDNGVIDFFNNAGSAHLIADLAGYYTQSGGSGYNATTPTRMFDTRTSGTGRLGTQGTTTVTFNNVPLGTTAVTLNLTGVDADYFTYLTAYPTGQPRPLASSLNLVPNQAVPNQVTVALGANRSVTFYNDNSSTNLVVDLMGFYGPSETALFYPTFPTRFLDTRLPEDAPGLNGGEYFNLLLDPAFLEPGTNALAFNVTGTNTTGNTYLAVWPSGQALPGASNLNLSPGQTAPNTAAVGLGGAVEQGTWYPAVSVYNNAGYVDVIMDVFGFFAS